MHRRGRRPRPRRAGTGAGPRKGRSDSAPGRRRGADAATQSGRPSSTGRSARGSEIDPLVQGSRPPGVAGEVIDEACDSRVVPRAAEPGPDLVEAVLPEVAADEGQGV